MKITFLTKLFSFGYKIFLAGIITLIGILITELIIKFILSQLANKLSLLRFRQKDKIKKQMLSAQGPLFFLVKIIGFVIFLFYILSLFGIKLSSLLAGAGVIGIIIGLATQSLFRDILKGLSIIIEDQFHPGDIVKINNLIFGQVKDVNLKRTIIETPEGILYFISNSQINLIANYTKKGAVLNLVLAFEPKFDMKELSLIVEEINQALKNSQWQTKIIKPLRIIGLEKIEPESISVRFQIEIDPQVYWEFEKALRLILKEKFEEKGVVIKKEI